MNWASAPEASGRMPPRRRAVDHPSIPHRCTSTAGAGVTLESLPESREKRVRNDTPDNDRGTTQKPHTSERVDTRERRGHECDSDHSRADRCDRCGAAARVRAKLPSGAELLFCQHHANEHEAKLTELAAVLELSGDPIAS